MNILITVIEPLSYAFNLFNKKGEMMIHRMNHLFTSFQKLCSDC